jgi:hypothetical protein
MPAVKFLAGLDLERKFNFFNVAVMYVKCIYLLNKLGCCYIKKGFRE